LWKLWSPRLIRHPSPFRRDQPPGRLFRRLHRRAPWLARRSLRERPRGESTCGSSWAAILEQLGRIQRAIIDDPALAVGSSKELIESTAKVVLTERGLPVDDKDDVPALVKQAQQALGLHRLSTASGPDGSDAVRRILGSASSLAIGVAELRNRGYGTGHGARGARVGLRARHAHLAVNAATTWCQLMLDTLADRDAPWRAAAGE
jgi:hypothetical protein